VPSKYEKKILEKYNTLSVPEKEIAEQETPRELKPVFKTLVKPQK
jgi:hypothetical protein